MRREEPIIIIEDDLDDQDTLREVLRELEVKNEVRFFDDCDKAYEHLLTLREKPFLILCDINLPKVNGLELKQRIDASDKLRKQAIPFVFLTTSDSPQTVNAAYQITNLQGYFQKSQTMADIKEKVRCILAYWRMALHPS